MHRVPRAKSIDKPPYVIVQTRVLSATAPYTQVARLVALAIAARINTHRDADGGYSAWPSHATLAAETGLSVATVKRALTELCDGPHPLFARHRVKSTQRGDVRKSHPSCRYTLVEQPAAFAAARDRARAQNAAVTEPPHGDEAAIVVDHTAKFAARRQPPASAPATPPAAALDLDALRREVAARAAAAAARDADRRRELRAGVGRR